MDGCEREYNHPPLGSIVISCHREGLFRRHGESVPAGRATDASLRSNLFRIIKLRRIPRGFPVLHRSRSRVVKVPASCSDLRVNFSGYLNVGRRAYLVLLETLQGRPSGSERSKCPSSSQPQAGRFTGLWRLGAAMISSNRKRPTRRIPTKGTATRKFPQPDCRMVSCT